MRTDVKNTIDEIIASSPYSTDSIEKAVAQLEAATTILDGIYADYTVKFEDSIITIDVDPRISYDKTVFQIDIAKRTFVKLI